MRSGRKMIKNALKVACDLPEALRLMGEYYWLIDDQKKAFAWWSRSIREGERLGARLEVSKSTFEVGKHLIEPGSRYQDLHGVKAVEYLGKARGMFEEMHMQPYTNLFDGITGCNSSAI